MAKTGGGGGEAKGVRVFNSMLYCNNEFPDPCSKGLYHSRSDNKCKPCPLNSYNNEEAVVSCQSCPKGSLTHNTGSTKESDCIGKQNVACYSMARKNSF